MTDRGETPLDAAGRAWKADPDAATPWRTFLHVLADTELFVALTEEPRDATISPEMFTTDAGALLLAADREDRLTAFLRRPTPYAALPGRILAQLAAGQGVGVMLNPGIAASEHILDADVLGWLASTLAGTALQQAHIARSARPGAVPEALSLALERALMGAADQLDAAWLLTSGDTEEATGWLIALVGADPAHEPALAKSLADAVRLTAENIRCDVTFCAPGTPAALRAETLGVRLALPEPAERNGFAPNIGLDPERPPKLR